MHDKWLENIEIGQEVVVSGGGGISKPFVAKVERLTKTQIILVGSSTKYRRNSGRQIGGHAWYARYLREADSKKLAEIKHDQEKRKAVNYLSEIKWKDLSLKSLQAVMKVVENL